MRPHKVLIVDDEPDIELLIRQRFKRRNGEFEFVFARNGKEALEILESDPELEVVVTDINMPVMDGLSLLPRLNALDRLVKAVILSAYGDMQNIRSAMNRGAFDFLTKPLDFEDFETTIRRTKDALEAAREGLEARARLLALEQELEIASRIQSSILPRDFLAGHEEFELHAEMIPARRVGGDFYDYFLIDDRQLGFLIGDVSGKGIPAALFMAVSRTLLRATALQGVSPAECLQYANRVLGRQREGGVFVTVFYGILDTATGELTYAIGGHNPPYRRSRDGRLDVISEPRGTVIGLLPGMTYETGEIRVCPGDSIVLFTDGVTEAMNAEGRFFGERRLREVFAGTEGPPREVIARICEAVAGFTAGAPQSDDITLLAVRWRSSPAG
jgi:sigma-B regulation protein RsbU (phosphoserine phosphatase)